MAFTALKLPETNPMLAATYTWTAGNDVWSSPTNWSPQGVPENGDTVNLMFTDSVNRTIIYDYTGPPVTLHELNVNLIRGYALSDPTAKLLILGNELSAVTEYVGKVGDYPDAPNGGGVIRQLGGINNVGSGGLWLGYELFGEGHYILSATLNSSGHEYVGYNGYGYFNHGGGANTISAGHNLYLGVGETAYGNYVLAGGTLSVGDSVYVGSSNGGTGRLTVTANGGLTIAGTLTAYDTFQWYVDETEIELSGGTINTAALNLNGNPALLNWTSGMLNITNNVTFDSAAAGTTTSAAFGSARTLSSGQTLMITGNESLGGAGAFDLVVGSGATNNVLGILNVNSTGSLTVNSGGLVTTQEWMNINDDAGSAAHVVVAGSNARLQPGKHINLGSAGSGDLSVNNGGLVSTPTAFQVGPYGNSVGELTVSGANSTATAGWYMWVGWYGKGTVTVDGGGSVAMSTGDLSLAVEPGSEGTVNLNDGGTITANSGIYVGGNWATALGGKGILTVNSGGILNSNNQLEITPNHAETAVNLAGGTINVGALNFHGTPSLLNWTSGTLNINRNVTFDSAAPPTSTSAAFGGSLAIGAGQTLKITGNEGLAGAGTFALTVAGGGSHIVTGSLTVATSAGGVGQLTVTGSGSSVQSGAVVGIGYNDGANGALAISDGGSLQGTVINIGTFAGAAGQATVSGAGSHLIAQGAANDNVVLRVGRAGSGTLTLSDSAIAAANMTEIGRDLGAVGQVTVSGGASFETSQYLSVGTGYNPYFVPNIFVGPAGGAGTLTLNAGGSATVGVQLLIGNNGTVDLSGGGTLAVGNVGAMVPAAGSVLIGTGGNVAGTGTIAGAVVNDAGTIQPGFTANVAEITGAGTLHITGAFSQSAGGTLQIELAGTTRGTLHDALLATGQASLGGTLAVSLINDFTPALYDWFDILDASTMTGAFTMLTLPSLGDGLAWDTSQLDTMGVIRVAASTGLDGDFNKDSRVDAADYVLWRKSGSAENEYGDWRTNFGDAQEGMGGTASRSSSSAPAQQVAPEPSFTTLLVALGSLLALPRAFWRRNSRLRLRLRSLAFMAMPLIGANAVHAETLGFIEFCVDCAAHLRPTGHAFVRLHPAWGPARGTVLRLGFLPSTSDLFADIALELPGQLVFELPDAHCDASIIRSMSSKQYNDILNYLTTNYQQPPPRLRPKYNLKSHNCTDFMGEVADKGNYDLLNFKNIFGISDPQEWCYDCFPLPPGCIGGGVGAGCDITQPTTGALAALAQTTSFDGGESPRDYSYTSLVRQGHANAQSVANITGLAYDPMYLGVFNANTASGINVNLTNADLAHSIVSIDWGDGSAFQDEATAFQHVYTDPGTYYAELFAMDSGAVHSYGMMVSVSAAPGSAVDVAITSFPASTTPNPGLNPVESLTPVILGDFNDDGIADAADYVWWRKGLGSDYLPDDYDTWRTDFGRTYGEVNGSAAGMLSAKSTVPEPASLLLMLVFLVGSVIGRQSRPRAPRLAQ